jgi:hypothetical protein
MTNSVTPGRTTDAIIVERLQTKASPARRVLVKESGKKPTL